MGNNSSADEKVNEKIDKSLAVSQRGKDIYSYQSAFRRRQSRKENNKTEEYPYNCIGLLTWISACNNFRPQVGTAFLISPRIIVTALHNIYDQHGSLHQNIKFFPKPHNQIHFLESIPIIRAESVKKTQKNLLPNDEYCVLLLEEEVKRSKYITIGYNYQLVQNYNTEIYGYPIDLPKNKDGMPLDPKKQPFPQIGSKGKVVRIKQEIIFYDINTFDGQSGSPIIVETSDHQKIAIGIHTSSANKEKLNCGCQFTLQNTGDIKGWMKMLTGIDLKPVCASELLYEVNPLSENKRTRQDYKYITFPPKIYQNLNPQVFPDKCKERPKARSSLDMWQTIKKGTFDINRYPFNCIGLIVGTFFDAKLKTHRKHYGTGFLINSKIVLTSIHNLIKFQEGYVVHYQDLHFYPSLHGEIGDPENVVISVKNKKYNIPSVRPNTQRELAETSLALLELSDSVKRQKYILIGQDYEQKEQVFLFGYGWNMLNDTSSQATSFRQRGSEGKIIDTAKEIITHNAYSQNGSEGSPLLVEYVKGYFFIVGIHIKSKYQGQQKNCLAMQITAGRVKILNQWLKELKIKDKILSYSLKESIPLIEVAQEITYPPIQCLKYYGQQLRAKQIDFRSEVLIRLAQLSFEVGNYEASLKYLMEETSLKVGSYFILSDANKIEYFTFMGLNNLHLRNLQVAAKNLFQAQSILQKQPRESISPHTKIALYNSLGVLYSQNKDYPAAQESFNLMLRDIKGGSSDKMYKAISLNNIATLYVINNKMNNLKFQAELQSAFNIISLISTHEQLLVLAKIAYNLSAFFFFTANFKRATEFLSVYLTTTHRLQLEIHPQHLQNMSSIRERAKDFMKSKIVASDMVLRMVKIMRKFSDNDKQIQEMMQQMIEELYWARKPQDQH